MSLRLRLVVALLAAAAIAIVVLDVGYLMWRQDDWVARRELRLEATAVRLAVNPDEEAASAMAQQSGLMVGFLAQEGDDIPSGHSRAEGWARYRFDLPPAERGWRAVVVAEPLQRLVDDAIAEQRRIVPWLVGSGLLMVVVGLVFLRRSVMAPMARLTELVQAADTDGLDGLRRLGVRGGDWARLGHAITAMNRTIDLDRKHIAEQLEQLEKTQRQLVRAERLAVVGRLAAGLAHEVGNPLAIVGGYVEFLQRRLLDADSEPGSDADSDADTQRALGQMAQEVDRIHGTVRDLLDFSRTPSFQSAGETDGDVGDALGRLADLLRPQQKMRAVKLEILLPDGPAIPIALSTDALLQVLLNLCLNAADALAGTPEPRRLRVSVARPGDDGRVQLYVDDSGPGVGDDIAAQIFEPFFTTKDPGAGTGLGLSVCERIVAAVDGDLEVSPSPLGGARFTVGVPAAAGR